MAEIFSYKVQASPSASVTLSTISSQFGDGYSQAAANGINNKSQSWTIKIKGHLDGACAGGEDVTGAYDFLDDHGGWRSFEWITPLGYTGLFCCNSYGIQKDGKVATLSASFFEVFR